MKPFLWRSVLVLAVGTFVSTCWSASYYTRALNDPKAVCVEGPSGTDDTAVLQHAINQVQETTGQGIVLLAPGKYRVSDTIYVWPGIRVIGYGQARPTIALSANAAGFQDAGHEKVIFFFAGGRPGVGRGRPRNANSAPAQVSDANPGTFYSAMANVDIEIESGNSGAVAVRSRYAQHCFLAHMEMRLGSGLAGVHESGNVIEDVRFIGGHYGIWTSKPSPSWQLTVIDSYFERQTGAAILEHEAGLTLIRPHFVKVPTAVEVESGWADELWIKDGYFEDVFGPAITFSVENNPRNEINVEGAVCQNVPVFVAMRESGKCFSGAQNMYRVQTYSHGLHFGDFNSVPEISDVFESSPLSNFPTAAASDLPALPPCNTWVNVRDLGAKGDGLSDDTEALHKAIAAHRTLYFPSGFYIVKDTLTLRPDTVLVGLHPGATQIILPDGTPAYQGIGGPKALLEAPKGGSNIVIGLGLYTSGQNPRAVAALWKAGENSLMNDVRFLGGHGTPKPDGSRENPYNPNHSADPEPNRRWDSQYPSLWVTDGGGGTFLDLWTPSTFAQAGMLVSDTETEGRVYQVSSEHHVRHEVQVRNAAHWRFYALQTEEERGESGFALPLEIDSSRDISVANFHMYRVISCYQPFPYAIKVSNSRDIRFRNLHCYSNSKVSFDSTVHDLNSGIDVRQHELAWLDYSGKLRETKPHRSSLVARGAKVEKLAGGFYNISGGATSPTGDYYFIDSRWQRIYHWSCAACSLSTISDAPLDPINLAVDQCGNLIVVSGAGKGIVYTIQTNGTITTVSTQTLTNTLGKRLYLPISDWRVNRESLSTPSACFVSPDGSTALPVAVDFLNGAVSWGVKSSPQIRSFGLARAIPGQPFYVSDEAQLTTFAADVAPDGSLSKFRLFADQGSEGVAVDSRGNVLIAAGQVYVYSPKGKLIDTIEVPERPLQVVFGGKDNRTLFIAARSSLYSVRMKVPGR